MTYLPKWIIPWCQDVRGRVLEPCHDRRNGKVAFQMDMHMVIRGIIVCVCVIDFFRGEEREEENLPQGEKIIHLKVEFRPKQRKLDLENLVRFHILWNLLTNWNNWGRVVIHPTEMILTYLLFLGGSFFHSTHVYAFPDQIRSSTSKSLSFHKLWLINTSSVMLFNSKSFM